MRLPDHIYNVVKPLFAPHAPWHYTRTEESASLRGPGTQFPDLKGVDEAGSGEQFLRFHRDMVRVFEWVLEDTPGPQYDYVRWDRLPAWLVERFDSWDPEHLPAVHAEIDRLVVEGSAGELGNFIEATRLSDHPRRNIHNHCHGVVAEYEYAALGEEDARLSDASMNSSRTAPHNEHFWSLHGWIDDLLARWQEQHGEAVDRSPLAPDDSHHGYMTTARQVPGDVSGEDEAEVFDTLIAGATLEDEERLFGEKIFVPLWR